MSCPPKQPPALTDILSLFRTRDYTACVGRMGNRWVGFTAGRLDDGSTLLCMIGEVSERHELGLRDRDQAIPMTIAAAEQHRGYGPVVEWLIPEEMRGDPSAYVCPDCDEVHLPGRCEPEDDAWYED